VSRIVVATGNRDKVREIAPILAEAGFEAVAVVDRVASWSVAETGATLAENARLKARAAVEATGQPALADDTGLFVDALEGAPGVFSSRYAGEDATYADNVARLLEDLADVPREERTARFRTVVVHVHPDGEERAVEGVLEGTILERPRGTGGFGYDPVFRLGDGRALSELPLEEKNGISHRARAIRAMVRALGGSPGRLGASG